MKKAREFVRVERKEERVKRLARVHLQDVYFPLGFEVVLNVYLKDGIPHVDMLLERAAD